MNIRDATAADAAPLAEVQITAWRAAYRGLVPDDFLNAMDTTVYTRNWERILAGPSGRTIVATDGAGICGYCSHGPARGAESDPQQLGEIYAMYVHPRRWRCGIGRSLCLRAIELLREARFAEIMLWMAEGNVRAEAFYATLGFMFDGGRKVETAGTPITHLRYRRPA